MYKSCGDPIVTAGPDADLLRDAPLHRLAPARRRPLMHGFATLAAIRLTAAEDPVGMAGLRAALRAD